MRDTLDLSTKIDEGPFRDTSILVDKKEGYDSGQHCQKKRRWRYGTNENNLKFVKSDLGLRNLRKHQMERYHQFHTLPPPQRQSSTRYQLSISSTKYLF